MVKEGLFLNSDLDYTTTCSRLVHLKKSRNIADDVKSGPAMSKQTEERKTKFSMERADLRTSPPKRGQVKGADEKMLDFKVDLASRVVSKPQLPVEVSSPPTLNREEDRELCSDLANWNEETNRETTESAPVEATFLSEDDSISDQDQHVYGGEMEEFVDIDQDTSMGGSAACMSPEGSVVPAGVVPASSSAGLVPASSSVVLIDAKTAPHRDVEEYLEKETSVLISNQKEEAFREKLKLILR